MSKLTYRVEPQRLEGTRWVPCPEHQARRFAVVSVQHFKRGHDTYTSIHIVHHCLRKVDAEREAERRTRAAEGPIRRLLGGRFGQFKGTPIAASIPVSAHAQPCPCRACQRSAES